MAAQQRPARGTDRGDTDARVGTLLGLGVFGLLLLAGRAQDLLPSPQRMVLVLLWPVLALGALRLGPRVAAGLTAGYLVGGGLLLRLADFRGGGRASDVLLVTDEAIGLLLRGQSPYGHEYASSRPPGAPMPYPPVQLLVHLPGRLMAGFDGVGFTEIVAAGVIMGLFALLAARLSWRAGLPALATYAALPNLGILTLDGSNDTSTGAVALVAVLATAWAGRNGWAARPLTVAGFAGAAALGMKQSTLFIVLTLAAHVWHAAGWRALRGYVLAAASLLLALSLPFLAIDPVAYLTGLAAFAGFHSDVYGWNVWVLARGLGWPLPELARMTLVNVAATLAALLLVTARPLTSVAQAALAGLIVTLVLLLTAYWTSYAYFALVAPIALVLPLVAALSPAPGATADAPSGSDR